MPVSLLVCESESRAEDQMTPSAATSQPHGSLKRCGLGHDPMAVAGAPAVGAPRRHELREWNMND
jgi:hypothetical protein